MNNQDTQFVAQKIRAQYVEGTPSELDALRRLDARVKRPVMVFAYVLGSLAALVMGSGMSLVMTDLPALLGLGDALIPGVVIGAVGLLLALVNYPLYVRRLAARKKKFAPKILALSEKIMQA